MAQKPDGWMPLDVRKYLGDTMHLTRDQHGGYLLLIMAYWMRGGPLMDNDRELAAIARASLPDWKRLRGAMEVFFEVTGGKWIHHKIEKELKRAKEIIEKKAAAGKRGAETRWRTNGEPIADAMANASQTDAPLPLPIPKKEESILPEKTGVKVYSADFLAFWKAYPTDQNMAKKPTFYQWRKLSLEDRAAALAALPGFKKYCKANDWYRPVHAERFLSERRFENYEAEVDMAPEAIEEAKDKADRYFKRGKYAENYQ